MAGLIYGALGGLGEAAIGAGKQLGDYAAKSTLEQEMADIQKLRDQRLEEFAQQRQNAQFAHEDTAAAADRTFTSGENDKNRTFQTDLEKNRETAAGERQKAGFAHDEKLAAGRNKLLQAQIDATNNGFTLQPLSDGRLLKVGKDGSTSYLMDPNDPTKPLIGPKDVSSSAKMLVEGNNKIIEGLMKQASDPLVQQPQKAALNQQIDGLRAENKRLLGFADSKSGKPQPAAIKDPFAAPATAPAAPTAPAQKPGLVGEAQAAPEPKPVAFTPNDARERIQEQQLIDKLKAKYPSTITPHHANLGDARTQIETLSPQVQEILNMPSGKERVKRIKALLGE